MSLTRFQRGVRQLGMGAGSHLARPPQKLPEPDVRPSAAYDPDFRTGLVEGGSVGVVQLYPDVGAPPFPGFEVSNGVTGDQIVLWILAEDDPFTAAEADLSVVFQQDSGFTNTDTLTVVKTHRMAAADATFFLATGPRIADLQRIDMSFAEAGPVTWSIGTFPAGTWSDAGEDTYASDTGSFSPTGTGIFAGIVIAYFEAGSPLIDYPGEYVDAQQDGDFYSLRTFAFEGSSPTFGLSMVAPSNLLQYAHALVGP